MNRAAAEARGRRAERRAAWWLRLHGWRILGQRLRVAAGEVDLVARRGTGKALAIWPDARAFALLDDSVLTADVAPLYGRAPDARLPASAA